MNSLKKAQSSGGFHILLVFYVLLLIFFGFLITTLLLCCGILFFFCALPLPAGRSFCPLRFRSKWLTPRFLCSLGSPILSHGVFIVSLALTPFLSWTLYYFCLTFYGGLSLLLCDTVCMNLFLIFFSIFSVNCKTFVLEIDGDLEKGRDLSL